MIREPGMSTLLRENTRSENKSADSIEIESVFSFELQERVRRLVADIRQTLHDQPVLADRLLSRYTRFAEDEKQKIKKASKLYEEIFYEKKLDEKEAVEIVLGRLVEILDEIAKKIIEAKDKKEKIIEEILDNLSENQKVSNRATEEIKKIAEQVNQMCAEIEQVRVDIANKEDEIWREHMEEQALRMREARETIDRKEFRENWEKQGWVFEDDAGVEDFISELYDESEYFLDDNFPDDGFHDNEEEQRQREQYEEKFRKYDSYRIKNDIERFEKMYDKDGSQYKFAAAYLDPQIAENTKRRSNEARKIFEPLRFSAFCTVSPELIAQLIDCPPKHWGVGKKPELPTFSLKEENEMMPVKIKIRGRQKPVAGEVYRAIISSQWQEDFVDEKTGIECRCRDLVVVRLYVNTFTPNHS